MAIRVQFQGTEADPSIAGASFWHHFAEDELLRIVVEDTAKATTTNAPISKSNAVPFRMNFWQSLGFHTSSSLFSSTQDSPVSGSLAFDGMSCTAFKMEHLQSASSQQPRGLFSYTDQLQSAPSSQPLLGSLVNPADQLTENTRRDSATTIPFDGMSCTAFKLDHLQATSSQKPRGIYSYADQLQSSTTSVNEAKSSTDASPQSSSHLLNDASQSSSDISNNASPLPKDTPARQTLPSHLELKAIPGKGLGVITTVAIPKNTAVGDYTGEVITTQVKDRRYLPSQQHLQDDDDIAWAQSRKQRGQGLTGTYLYGVSMPGHADPIYIDAEDEYASLWTRFLNHASPPANNLSPKSIHESWDGNPRVWFVSNRNIDIGEELCFDYGDDYWLPGDQVF